MGTNKDIGSQGGLSRLTIDIPKKTHKRLKAVAALQGKSMREYVSDLIAQSVDEKIPNEKTLEAIAAVEEEKDLVEVESTQELFDKLDI